MKPIRVLVADDHPLFRRGLVNLLAETSGIEVVGEAASGPQAVELTGQLEPDVVLMDVVMPGGGIEATRAVCQAMPRVKVLMLTVSEDNENLFEAIEAGASGYLLKEIGPEDLVQAIQQVYSGQAPLSPVVAVKVLQRLRQTPGVKGPDAAASSQLTPREEEIVRLLALGLTNQKIAQRLVVAESTIKSHIRNLLRKSHTRNRAEIVTWGTQIGLIGGDSSPKD